jgi:excisionase family DNA binding protein
MPHSKVSKIDAARSSGTSPTRLKTTLSTSEAAKYIGVSKKTLLKYCRQHHVVYMRYTGGEFRFRPTALDVFMARCTIQAERAA